MTVRFQRIHPAAVLPQYAHPGDAGLDLCACETLTISGGAWALVRTGLILELPAGTEGQVRPRSGLAIRHGVTCLNAPGTIDSDYRGELQVILINLGHEPFVIARGDRIAQLLVQRVESVVFREVAELPPSGRGAGGFGSTGR